MEKVIAAVIVCIFTIAILAGVYGAVWWLCVDSAQSCV